MQAAMIRVYLMFELFCKKSERRKSLLTTLPVLHYSKTIQRFRVLQLGKNLLICCWKRDAALFCYRSARYCKIFLIRRPGERFIRPDDRVGRVWNRDGMTEPKNFRGWVTREQLLGFCYPANFVRVNMARGAVLPGASPFALFNLADAVWWKSYRRGYGKMKRPWRACILRWIVVRPLCFWLGKVEIAGCKRWAVGLDYLGK